MKKLLYSFLFLPALALAAPAVYENGINGIGTPTCVSVGGTGTDWTLFPTNTSASGRAGILLTVSRLAANDVVGFFGDSASSSTVSGVLVSTSTVTMEFVPGKTAVVGQASNVYLWLYAIGGSAITTCGQEYKQ